MAGFSKQDQLSRGPKRTARHKATKAEWQRIVEAKDGPCRVCGGRRESFHHLLARSLGGDDVAENLVPLCGDGVRGDHGAVEARNPRACALLGASLTPEERLYLSTVKSPEWIVRRYG